ncbi:phytanoyl-CoA dioxygenase family protein [Nannocystaceae bacterium ST9]
MASARGRRHASTRGEVRRALAHPRLSPSERLAAGLLLFVTRDHAMSLATLVELATRRNPPSLAAHAIELTLRLAGELGWRSEQRSLRARLAPHLPEPLQAKLRDRTLERERDQAARLHQLSTRAPDEVAELAFAASVREGSEPIVALLDALLEQHGPRASLIGARVRLDLQHGRLAAAARRMAALPDSGAERALVGHRIALALALGDVERALELEADPREPWQLALRGEALLVRGELELASEQLERARELAPGSLAITLVLTLARARGHVDDRGQALAEGFAELLEGAPALMSDAAALEGIEAWTDFGPLRDPVLQLAVLTRAHRLLTPERDSWLASYTLPSGTRALRHLAPRERGRPSHLERLLAGDPARIEQAERWSTGGVGSRTPRAPSVRVRDWTPRTLDANTIEQFVVEGFTVVREGFDREVAAQWVADAQRRIRDAPERWVRGYGPRESARDLRGFDPDDPATWTWNRVDLEGNQRVVIEAFAPRVWAAIVDLLGGPERIETRTWTNYLLVNLGDPRRSDPVGPPRDWPSWHLDDPSPALRLDRLRNGLIGVALLSDLRPRSGNTWLALDSVAKVSRELADRPEGLDVCGDYGVRVARQCERFHEITGRAGDFVLVHPLMVHSASSNRSGRIRWMSNPMIYVNEPLRPARPLAELSPVELAIRRAIDGRSVPTG